jgi:uncharacterized protein (TIGR02265 family)
MYSPQQSFEGMQVKGGLLRARFLFVILNHSADVWSSIVEKLPEEDHLLLEEINIEDWYPVATLDRVDQAIANTLGGDSEEVFDQLGEFSATNSLSGPYSSLLNTDIHSFLSQSALIHRAYQNFGTPAYEQLSETSGLLTIKYEAPAPQSFCISGNAYFRHAVELCGARSARANHTRCCGRGDTVCEFYLTWQS